MDRVVIGLLMSPLLIAIIAGIENSSLSGVYVSATQISTMALLIALAHSLLLGLPLFLLCLRLKNLEWWVAAIAGVVIGQLIPLILLINGYPSLRFPVYFGSWGIFGSVVFWWIAIPGNPRFSFVRDQFPKSAILSLPLGLIGVCLSYRLN